MTLDEIRQVIEGEVLVEPPYTLDLDTAGASDLMSDILLFARPNILLITGLTNPQVMRTAEMAEIPAVLFVRHKHPPKETLALAREMGIGKVLAVANKVASEREEELIRQRLSEGTPGVPLAAVIRYHKALRESDLTGEAVYRACPELLEEVGTLLDNLGGSAAGEVASEQ